VDIEVPVSSISQHGSVANVIDIRSDSEDDFNDCSYSTDDHHSNSNVDNHNDMSNCESVESISSENLIANAVPNTATTFSSALEGQSTSCAYVLMLTLPLLKVVIAMISTAVKYKTQR